MTRGLAALLAAALLCPALTSCGSSAAPTRGDSDMTTSIEQAPVRTDLEPLTSRFPGLGPLVEAHWVGGRLGDDRAPGPSTYFIEAVVRLADPERAARDDAQPAPAPDAPPALRPVLDGGAGWTTSADLDGATGPQDWGTAVHLRPGTDLAYLSARGG